MMTMRKYLILFLFLVGGFVLCVPSILRASELQENHIVKTIDDNSVVKMSNAESAIYQNSVRKIARGESHTIVVRNDGTVWSWGENNCGALGVGDSVEASDIPLQVIDLTNIIKVSASRFSTIALKEDGTVWYWGNYYDYHRGYYKEAYVPIQFTNFNDVVDIVCSDDYIVALKADGSVWQYGRSFYTCTGSFEKVIDLPKVSKLAISIDNIMAAITDNGEAWIWGEDYQSPTQINVNSAVSISVNNEVVVAKSDGTVWVFDNIKASGYQLDTSNVAIVDGAGVYLQILKNDGTMEFWLKHYGKWGLAAAQHFAYDDIVASSGYSGGTTILRQDGTVWQLEESYTSIIDDNVMVKSEGDLPFWWTGYYVSYDENGGVDAPDKQIKGPGVVLQLTDAIPSREGFVFKGWSTSPNGKVLYTPSSNYEVDSDIMLYAIWEPGYAIVYEVNGYYDVIEMQIKKKGEPLLLDASIHRSGNKIFAGWATKADGDVVYAPGALYKEDVAITLHARWILEETEECSCKNGYLSSDCSSCNSGKITTTYDCFDCGGTGKVNKEKETTAQCQICHGIGLSWSLTLQDYVRCAFCSGTGEFTYTDIVEVRCSRCSGSGIGYGQATCSECSGSGKKFRDCPDCTVAGIKILNEEYRLSYNANGGENAPYGKTNYVGVSVCISSEIPKRFRYTFEGWSLQPDGEVVYWPGDTYLGEESLVLYAIWCENKCQDDMHIFSYNQGMTCEYCGFSKQPQKPQLESKTKDSIILVINEDYEYSMDGETWQDSNVFTGLADDTSYTFYQRVKESSIALASEKSEGLEIRLKIIQDTPTSPTILSYTDTTVILRVLTNGEYSIDGTIWQQSNVFENLSSGTEYIFYQRYAETETHEVSATSAGTSVITDKSKQILIPNEPSVQNVTSDSITLVTVDGCEYSKNGTTWQTSNVFSGLSCGTEYTFYQRYKETSTTYAGKSSEGMRAKTDKGTQSAPSKPTLSSKTYNSVILVKYSGYEYSMDGINWQTSNVFIGLNPETNYLFYQRKTETDRCYASASSISLTVKTNEEPKYITGDFNNDQAVTDADALYLLYHTIFGDTYPIEQDCDYNNDGSATDADALYLLYHTIFGDSYPLN